MAETASEHYEQYLARQRNWEKAVRMKVTEATWDYMVSFIGGEELARDPAQAIDTATTHEAGYASGWNDRSAECSC